jgi:hypothetical protein
VVAGASASKEGMSPWTGSSPELVKIDPVKCLASNGLQDVNETVKDLNPPQRRAVTHGRIQTDYRALLVIAGAGSENQDLSVPRPI